MKILILEDNAERMKYFRRALIGHEVHHTEFSKNAIELLKQNKYDVLFLDHDLGGQEMVQSGIGTGYETACFLEQHSEYMPGQIILHSLNSIGAQNMKRALPNAIWEPGIWLKLEELLKEKS